jgi:ActR/RegA family two-component response regulator
MTDLAKLNYNGKKAILVDDDLDLLEQIKIQLESIGFEVTTGETQAEGEKLIETTTPDLAIFDLMLENHDSGFILSYKLKKKFPATPVILITGVANETGIIFDASTDETREWVKADVILDKEIRFEQLEREIERLLK